MLILTVIGVIVTALALPVAIFDWLDIRPGGGSPPSAPTTTVPASTGRANTTTDATGPTTGAKGGSFRYLSTLRPELGAGNLTELPRSLPGPSTYARAVAIRCPTNGPAEKLVEVGYPLQGDYFDFTATVRPVFRSADDHATVTAFAVTKNIDDTTNKRQVGQQTAAGTTTRVLIGDVKGAQQLILQVRCESPEGVVVVDDGRLTTEP